MMGLDKPGAAADIAAWRGLARPGQLKIIATIVPAPLIERILAHLELQAPEE